MELLSNPKTLLDLLNWISVQFNSTFQFITVLYYISVFKVNLVNNCSNFEFLIRGNNGAYHLFVGSTLSWSLSSFRNQIMESC
jgi:hypothetical protein